MAGHRHLAAGCNECNDGSPGCAVLGLRLPCPCPLPFAFLPLLFLPQTTTPGWRCCPTTLTRWEQQGRCVAGGQLAVFQFAHYSSLGAPPGLLWASCSVGGKLSN